MKASVVLLIWVTAASVRGQSQITVRSSSNGVSLTCTGLWGTNELNLLELEAKDENSGEYSCVENNKAQMIYVKFRSCDNCVELDIPSLAGILVGNVVATIAISVAVYLTVSHSRTHLSSSQRKSSDKQHLVPNEMRTRAPNDHYQPLNPRGAQKDTYDLLTNRR